MKARKIIPMPKIINYKVKNSIELVKKAYQLARSEEVYKTSQIFVRNLSQEKRIPENSKYSVRWNPDSSSDLSYNCWLVEKGSFRTFCDMKFEPSQYAEYVRLLTIDTILNFRYSWEFASFDNIIFIDYIN